MKLTEWLLSSVVNKWRSESTLVQSWSGCQMFQFSFTARKSRGRAQVGWICCCTIGQRGAQGQTRAGAHVTLFAYGGGTVHWKQRYRGQFHILHWISLLFCSSSEIKVRIQYSKLVSIHFMSNVWLKAHFPQKSSLIWWKICIFDTKNLISRYFTTFHFPNYLNLQKMNKIQLYSYGEIQAKQI